MRQVITNIEDALKRLYLIDTPYSAEHFLLPSETDATSVASATQQGALLIKGTHDDLSVGIFLSPEIRRILAGITDWNPNQWSHEEFQAFMVAAEEISHFHYLVFHASNGRQLTQLELEVQGEIDKFFLSCFASHSIDFERMFEALFYRFRLADGLAPEQRSRYEETNRLARQFVLKYGRPLLLQPSRREQTFRLLRRFYRLGGAEKLSLIGT